MCFKNWFKGIKESDNQQFLDTIAELNKQLTEKDNALKDCSEKRKSCEETLSSCRVNMERYYNQVLEKEKIIETIGNTTDLLSNKVEWLTSELTKLSPNGEWAEDIELAEYWNNKYKLAIMTYKGRSLPYSTTTIPVPVNVLLTPHDPYIIQDLKKWGLYRTGEDPETLVPKIYKKIKEVYYNYKYDNDVWGTNEVWEFPFEMREKANLQSGKWAFDCDSWSSFQASYYIAAGVPRWRVHVVAGMCDLGGHSTVYVYSKKINKFVHLNSTYGGTLHNKLSLYPTHKDAEEGRDMLGIKEVWLSYNDLYCWYDFEGDIPESSKIQILKKI